MFDKKELEKHIATSWLGRSFYFFEALPSTNSYAKKLAREETLHGVLVATDQQTEGRGQYNRKWESDGGESLTFSLMFEPPKPERLPLLTIACALAVTEVLEDFAGIKSIIKWPNDIICDNKKMCGILTETVFSGNVLDRVIVGLGININQSRFEGDLKKSAISVRQAAKNDTKISREYLLARLLQKIEYRYEMWLQQTPDLIKQINLKLEGFGEWRKIQVDGKVLKRKHKFLGVNESGELLALTKELDIKKFTYEQIRIL